MSSRLAFIGGLVLASVVALTSVGAEAHVSSNMLSVKTKEGKGLRTREGLCVITRWQGNDSACDGIRSDIALEDRTVYFDFNDSSLTDEAKSKLDGLLAILKSDKEIQNVSIVGYADRIGSADYNQKLSRKRALSVKEYLASQGYTNANVTKVRWVGKSKPSTNCGKQDRNTLISCLSPDRKVEIEVNYVKKTKVRKGAEKK